MDDKPFWASKVWISKDKKFAYHNISKNASMSFRRCGLFGKGTMNLLVEYKDIKHLNLINIAIFREPVDRFVSAYLWLRNKHFDDMIKKYNNIFESFEDFVKILPKNEVTRSQSQFIKDRGITLDDIHIKMLKENIINDVNSFKKKYNLNIKLIHINKTNKKENEQLKSYIDKNPWIKEKIESVYQEDIELYRNIINFRNNL